MASLKGIRSKITIIQNTKKITRAMEMIAVSKMHKAKARMESGFPYAETIRKIIDHLTLGNLEYRHHYLNDRTVKKVGYLVISTDRGLTGSLNINLFKELLIDMKKWNEKNVKTELALIGSKAVSFFNWIGKNKVVAQVTGMGDNPNLSELIGLIKIMLQAYDEGYLSKLYIANNKFVNAMFQMPQILQILPCLPEKNTASLKSQTWDYLYEPDPKTLLDILLRRYVESQIYQSVVENLASEQAARMIAMKSATDSSSSLIKELQLIYNKTRQAYVTQELTEIISGSAVN